MKEHSYSIWIEAEQWDGIMNSEDENSDVIVKFEDGSEWSATFFTYQNIFSIWEKNKTSGENLNGNYFWASDMMLGVTSNVVIGKILAAFFVVKNIIKEPSTLTTIV